MSVGRTPACVVRLKGADHTGPVTSARPPSLAGVRRRVRETGLPEARSGADERAEPLPARRVRSVEVVAHRLGSPGVSRTARHTVR